MRNMEKVLLLFALTLILTGVSRTVRVYQGYERGRESYSTLKEAYTMQKPGGDDNNKNTPLGCIEAKTEAPALPADAPGQIQIDWGNLLADYEGIIAWIWLPAVELSYPVMQANDNDYFLHRAPDGGETFAGSIFMDCKCSSTFKNYNTIIYGHNMRDGSMFARLKNYTDQYTLSSCPYFWICTPIGDYLYRIFSVHTATTGEGTYTIRFPDQKAYTEWLNEMAETSEIETGDDIPSETRVVTLSTCTGNASMRQVIQGYLIWGE